MGCMINTLGQGSGRIRGENPFADELEEDLNCTVPAETLVDVSFIMELYIEFHFPEPGSEHWDKLVERSREYFKTSQRSTMELRTKEQRANDLVEILRKKIGEHNRRT